MPPVVFSDLDRGYQAVYDNLLEVSELTALVGSALEGGYQIYRGKAPDTAQAPYAIFRDRMTGRYTHGQNGRPIFFIVDFQITLIVAGMNVESIATENDVLLALKAVQDKFTVNYEQDAPGGTSGFVMRGSTSYPEDIAGVRHTHHVLFVEGTLVANVS